MSKDGGMKSQRKWRKLRRTGKSSTIMFFSNSEIKRRVANWLSMNLYPGKKHTSHSKMDYRRVK